MKNLINSKDFIVTETDIQTWNMHSATKSIQIKGKSDYDKRSILTKVPDDREFIVVRDYSDENEYEFSILIKYDKKYYFITDAGNAK
jgi:hypothetical protein